jgi:parvulin-like peptidyl-prolyl isomerase
MKVGDISEPVRTEYGFHIIKLTKRREGGKISLDKDWQQVEQWALAQKRNKEMQDWVESLREKIYVEIKTDSTEAK